MKKLLYLLFFAFGIVSCSTQESKMTAEEYGEEYRLAKVDVNQAISIDDFFADFEQQDSTGEYTVRGKIVEKCTNAGCWVGIDKGNGDYFMVSFKDHFTIPLDTKIGTEAIFHGIARWDSTTVEELRDIARKEGKNQEEINAITSPAYSYGFEADGIVLKK